MEERTIINGKRLLQKSEMKKLIKKTFNRVKGSGYRRLCYTLKEDFQGVTERATNTHLKALPDRQLAGPVFDNKADMRPVKASAVQERHQVDLVDLRNIPARWNGKIYLYVLSVLDVFSRYVWLTPLETKHSSKVAHALRDLYTREGAPKILQSDNGGEFKRHVTKLCEQMNIKQIKSAPYHPQSQGKIESSHKVWKSKLRYDYNRGKINWAKYLGQYATLRNTELHSSIGTTPFEAYYCRKYKSAGHSKLLKSKIGSPNGTRRLSFSQNIRQRVAEHSLKCNKGMIEKHQRTNPCSVYFKGDTVLIRPERKKKEVLKGTVVKTKQDKNMYLIRLAKSGKEGWKHARNLAGSTRAMDIERRSKQRTKCKVRCQCSQDECFKMANKFCTNQMTESCCRSSWRKCTIPSHNKLNLNEFVANTTLCELAGKQFRELDSLNANNQHDNYDNLITHALTHNLLPEGDIPKDGNCMFHSLAQSLNVRQGKSLQQEDVRNDLGRWLHENPNLPDGEALSNFVHNSDWNSYIQGILSQEWGDHICLVAAAELYRTNIVIVSSLSSELMVIRPRRDPDQVTSSIYLGHESEVHYIRLEPLSQQEVHSTSHPIPEGQAEQPDNAPPQAGDAPPQADDAPVQRDDAPAQADDDRTPEPSCTGRQSPHLTSLPNEILMKIFRHLLAERSSEIFSLRCVSPLSERFRDLISDLIDLRLYINPRLLLSLEQMQDVQAGVTFTWSVCKLIRLAGKSSGLATEIRKHLGNVSNWFHSRLTLLALPMPGWFKVIDILPPKSGVQK